jgi:hypothetical protein
LLRRHVRRRAEHGADDRVRAVARATRQRLVGFVEILREPPIDHDGLAVLADEHVRRLQIAMDDLLAVCVRECVEHGEHVRDQCEPLREGLALRDHLVECAADDALHRVERLPVRPPAAFVDRDDRRVLEPRADQRLALEPHRELRVGLEQLLDRDDAIEPRIECLDDPPHAAGRDRDAAHVDVALDDRQHADAARVV